MTQVSSLKKEEKSSTIRMKFLFLETKEKLIVQLDYFHYYAIVRIYFSCRCIIRLCDEGYRQILNGVCHIDDYCKNLCFFFLSEGNKF